MLATVADLEWEPSDGGRWAHATISSLPAMDGGAMCWVILVGQSDILKMTPSKARELAQGLTHLADEADAISEASRPSHNPHLDGA